MIKDILNKLIVEKKSLSYKEAKEVFLNIMEAKLSPAQVGALLTALRFKGVSPDEIKALAGVMREKSLKLKLKEKDKEVILDTCGTGGKPIKTFNISTVVAFIVASAGIKVAKHGNRSFSGSCGSIDLVEALGININASPKKVEEAIRKIGIGFLFAPLYHPAMKNVAQVRKELGIRTIFNIVGPLTNPAQATHQLLGVAEKELTQSLAYVLKYLGLRKAFVVWGEDVYDEISITGKTKITYLNNKKISTFYVEPRDFGLRKGRFSEIKSTSLEENLKIVKALLKGEALSSQVNIVLANASACFLLTGLVKSFREGVKLARTQIENGQALKKVKELREFLS